MAALPVAAKAASEAVTREAPKTATEVVRKEQLRRRKILFESTPYGPERPWAWVHYKSAEERWRLIQKQNERAAREWVRILYEMDS